METNEKQVSRNIKACRTKKGLRQEEIPDRMENKVTPRTYIKIENNPFRYNIYILNDVAKAIGCNINEFFLLNNFTESEEKN